MAEQHILFLGASGETGIIFINQLLALGDAAPLITLYVRASGRAKLPHGVTNSPKFRIIEGGLTDRKAIGQSLSSDEKFPIVTTVISALGAYPSLYYFLTRQAPTPIADAFNTTILPAMKEAGVKRILAMSTPCGFQYPEETKNMSWGWWAYNRIPPTMVPQGNAEMKGIANAVLQAGAKDQDLDWTIYRVGFLGDANDNVPMLVDDSFLGHKGSGVTRGSLSRWLYTEVGEKKWLRKAPMVSNSPT